MCPESADLHRCGVCAADVSRLPRIGPWPLPARVAERGSHSTTYAPLGVNAPRPRGASGGAVRSWAGRLQPGTALAIAGVLLPPKVYPWLPDTESQFPSSAQSANVATIPRGRTDVIRLRKSTSRSTALPVRATRPTRKPSRSRSVRRLVRASFPQGGTNKLPSRSGPTFLGFSAAEVPRDTRQANQGQDNEHTGRICICPSFI